MFSWHHDVYFKLNKQQNRMLTRRQLLVCTVQLFIHCLSCLMRRFSEKHWILGMAYTTRTFHLKKHELFKSFKQYFKVSKFQSTFSYCHMILMVRVLHQSPFGTKKTMINLLARSFLTYDEFRLLELMIPMRLRLRYRMLFV